MTLTSVIAELSRMTAQPFVTKVVMCLPVVVIVAVCVGRFWTHLSEKMWKIPDLVVKEIVADSGVCVLLRFVAPVEYGTLKWKLLRKLLIFHSVLHQRKVF